MLGSTQRACQAQSLLCCAGFRSSQHSPCSSCLPAGRMVLLSPTKVATPNHTKLLAALFFCTETSSFCISALEDHPVAHLIDDSSPYRLDTSASRRLQNHPTTCLRCSLFHPSLPWWPGFPKFPPRNQRTKHGERLSRPPV